MRAGKGRQIQRDGLLRSYAQAILEAKVFLTVLLGELRVESEQKWPPSQLDNRADSGLIGIAIRAAMVGRLFIFTLERGRCRRLHA
jgi:hypothetical protein